MFIIWLAKFPSFDWSIPGPITYGTDLDGHLLSFVYASFMGLCSCRNILYNKRGVCSGVFTSHLAWEKRLLA